MDERDTELRESCERFLSYHHRVGVREALTRLAGNSLAEKPADYFGEGSDTPADLAGDARWQRFMFCYALEPSVSTIATDQSEGA